MDRKAVDVLLQQWRREESEPFEGWDFSHIAGRYVEEQPPWSYMEMAKKLMLQSTAVLDLGTGGGEKLLAMKDCFPRRVVATEGYPPNLTLARRRLLPHGVEVVEAEESLEGKLPFANGEFDLVIDRHSAYNASEVARVLKPRGVFLTEQVDGRSLMDLHREFGYEPQWTFFTLEYALELIKPTELVVIDAREWEGKTVFRDVGALVYFLKAIPWIVQGFTVETHFKQLMKLQERLEKEGQLTFAERLLLIKAEKFKCKHTFHN